VSQDDRIAQFEESNIAKAGDSQIAVFESVIVGDVLDQPVDRVISVCSLVDRFGVALITHPPLHDKLTFGLEASANVLEDENIAIGNQVPSHPQVHRMAYAAEELEAQSSAAWE
jgi:hypothetical protein